MKADKLSQGRFLAITLLSPLIGGLLMCAVGMAMEIPSSVSEFLTLSAMVLIFGFVLGLVPAGLAAILYSIAFPHLRRTSQRALAAGLIGFMCGAFGLWAEMTMLPGFTKSPFPFVWLAGCAGSLALVLTGVPRRGQHHHAA